MTLAPLRRLASCLLWVCPAAAIAGPFADAVVSYTPGFAPGTSDPITAFTDPSTALGEPTRITSPTSTFGGPVTPLNGAFGSDEIVSIGEGGSLIARFDEPVANDALNPFGIDLLVFGNAFYFGSSFPIDDTTTADGLFAEPGEIAISSDGVNFTPVTGVVADELFPTAGFVDFVASTPSDFTAPVDPSIGAGDLVGLTTGEILNLYAGSGGGAGIDIGAFGLETVSFVRITNPIGSGVTPEIDAFADVRAVPEPATIALVLIGFAPCRRGRRG